MRVLLGLLMLLTAVGCTQPEKQPGGKYLFNTERCADAGPEDSAEYKDCKKRLAEEDAQRMYNLTHSGETVPGWQPPTSLPPRGP